MKDQILVCQQCGSEFVFAVGEQEFFASKKLEAPRFCPICRSIIAQTRKTPPKPVKPTSTTSDTPKS